MRKTPFAVDAQRCLNIIVGIAAFIANRAVPNLEINDIATGAIDKMMRDAPVAQASAYSGGELGLASVGAQHWMSYRGCKRIRSVWHVGGASLTAHPARSASG